MACRVRPSCSFLEIILEQIASDLDHVVLIKSIFELTASIDTNF